MHGDVLRLDWSVMLNQANLALTVARLMSLKLSWYVSALAQHKGLDAVSEWKHRWQTAQIG